MIPIWVCISKHGSDSTTHSVVLPKHTHYYSTETLANFSHWITVISWSPSQQNFYSARTIILHIKQNKLHTHTCTHSIFLCSAVAAVIDFVLLHLVASDALFWWAVINCSLVVFICACMWTLVVFFLPCEHVCVYILWVIAALCVFMYVQPLFHGHVTVSPPCILSLPVFGLLGTTLSLFFSWWCFARHIMLSDSWVFC